MVIDRKEVCKRLLAEGFARVYPPSEGGYYYGHGQFLDIDGNAVESSEEESELPPAANSLELNIVDKVDTTMEDEGDKVESTDNGEEAGVDPDLINALENEPRIYGKRIEACERQELYTYVENKLGIDVHHRLGKDKLIALIREEWAK